MIINLKNLIEPREWDFWVSSVRDGDISTAVLWIKHLLHWERMGWRVDLHKMTRADAPGKFHTHPAFAWRIVLAGGYVEETVDPASGELDHLAWVPGSIGLIEPNFCHRVHHLIRGPLVLAVAAWPLHAQHPRRGVRRREVQSRGSIAREGGCVMDLIVNQEGSQS